MDGLCIPAPQKLRLIIYKVPEALHFWYLKFLVNKHAIHDLGVSKNGGTPKWMVYNGKPY